MTTKKDRKGGPSTKTEGGRSILGLSDPQFKKDNWVVFLSEDHDGWIKGKVKRVHRNMYVPHKYDIKFTQFLRIQVIPYPNGMVEPRAEWKQLEEAVLMTIQEAKLKQNVPNLRHMLDKQMICDRI